MRIRLRALPAIIVLILGATTAASGLAGASTTAPSTSATTAPAVTVTTVASVTTYAIGQAVADVNIALDVGRHGIPISFRLSRIQGGKLITKAYKKEGLSIAATGVLGVSVERASLLKKKACRKAGVSSPCIKIPYAMAVRHPGKKKPKSYVAYVVKVGAKWLLSKKTACDLPQRVGNTKQLALPGHSAC